MSDRTNEGPEGGGMEDVSQIESMLRELDHDDLAVTSPPPAVWSAIEQTVARAPVVAIDARSRRHRWILAAAAVVVLAVAGGIIARIARDDDEELVSTAVLTHDP